MEFPIKGSRQWFTVGVLIFIINFCLLLVGRFQLGVTLDVTMVIGFAVIALLTSLITFMGYFGLDVLAKVAILSNALGLTYMIYITTTNASDGWSDLTSLIAFLYMLIMGMLVGIFLQIIKSIYNNFGNNKKISKKKKKH